MRTYLKQSSQREGFDRPAVEAAAVAARLAASATAA